MEHKDQILEEIKGLSYRDLDLYYLTYNSSLPKEIQDLMLSVHYDEIVKNIMENTIKISVPLKVSADFGRNWYEAK